METAEASLSAEIIIQNPTIQRSEKSFLSDPAVWVACHICACASVKGARLSKDARLVMTRVRGSDMRISVDRCKTPAWTSPPTREESIMVLPSGGH